MPRSGVTVLTTFLALAGCAGEAAPPRDRAATADVAADGSVRPLVVEGLAMPEAALYDADADVYLIANIDGDPAARDDNGFISRVRPDGTIDDLRWIDGRDAAVDLDGPKGMALSGDTLFVADIDRVRLFDRVVGAPLGTWAVDGARFLNDAAIGVDGHLYVTDTEAGSVLRLGPNGSTVVAAGDALAGPNGVAALPDGRLLVVGSRGVGTNSVDPATGMVETQVGPTTPGSDGVVVLDDGAYLISNWQAAAVLYFAPGAPEPDTVARGLDSPADMAWDAGRRRVIVPLLTRDRVVIVPVP